MKGFVVRSALGCFLSVREDEVHGLFCWTNYAAAAIRFASKKQATEIARAWTVAGCTVVRAEEG